MDNPNNDEFLEIKTVTSSTFQYLYKNHSRHMYFYALKFLNTEQAHDIVQDVFVKLWEKREEIIFKTSVKSYLFIMVRNGCLLFLEKQLVRREYRDQKAHRIKIEEARYYIARGGEKSLIEKDFSVLVASAMSKLPARCSEVFKLCKIEKLKHAEVAERLSISQKTVEKHMSQALKILRLELKEFLPVLLIFLK